MDVALWLERLGLGQYAGAFADNGVDAGVLPSLTAADLSEIGVRAVGHRRKLLDAIAALQRPADQGEPQREDEAHGAAERRQLTVLFVDLADSTALAHRLDPEEMRDVLRTYQNAVAGEIGRFEGYVAKFMGDGALAYFGWPRAHEDEAERAVRAGLAIVTAVARLHGGNEPLACRVGIATGTVVVGHSVGAGSAREQAVVGDTPNLAARLQGAAEPGTVMIGELTRRLVGDLFDLLPLEPRRFKGLPEPVPTYRVLGERPSQSRFAARRPDAATPVVGRDQELALLLERWRQASDGEGQLVLLTGDAGIGKSRVTEALIDAIAAEPHVLVRYQCSPYHAGSALHPAIQHLLHAAALESGDAPERRFARLESWLAGSSGAATPEALALLGALLQLPVSDRATSALTPQQRRARTLAALVDGLIDPARHQPVLWVVEDAHWIDPTTLELVELALDRVRNHAVLVVVTARPTFAASFASHPAVTRLVLNRLARTAVQLIVERINAGKRLPAELLDAIALRSDGVPLFVEEMTKSVLESGVLRDTGEGYAVSGALSGLAVPASLHDSLMARLDRLHPVKEVAQAAAVIGRSFDHATIAALSGLAEPALNDAMQRLVEAELVFRRGTPPEAGYLFKHALVRDAAYESLLKSERATMHARLTDVLERSGVAPPEIKAQHAEAGRLPERALAYRELAGQQALTRPAYREAVTHLEHAVRLCREVGERDSRPRREQALQLQLGQALIANQGYQAAATLSAFEHALRLADATGEVAMQLPALFGLWAGHHIAGTGSADLARRYAALAEMQPDQGPRLVGLRMLGLEQFYEGRFAESLELIDRSLAIYDPVRHRDLAQRFGHDPRAASANYRAWSLWHLGFPDQAAAVIGDNLRWIREVDHANTTGLVLCFGTMTNIWLRCPELVEAAAREALRLAEEMSLPLWHAWASIHLGWALSQQGTPGLDEISAGLCEAERIGAGRFEPFHLGLAAEALARAGRHDAASRSLDAAFEALERGHHQAFAADLHRLRGELAMRTDSQRAETELWRAIGIAREQASPALELRAATRLARLWVDRGERRRARELLAPVHGRFTEGFAMPDLVEAKAMLDAI